jgi:hypothetical protein
MTDKRLDEPGAVEHSLLFSDPKEVLISLVGRFPGDNLVWFRHLTPIAMGLAILVGSVALSFSNIEAGSPVGSWQGAGGDTAAVLQHGVSPPSPSRVRLDLTPHSTTLPPERLPDPESFDIDPSFQTRTWDDQNNFTLWGRYNRVEGVALFAGLVRRLSHRDYIPAYRAEIGFGFSADRGQYRLGFEQPIAPRGKVTLGAEGFRSYLPFFYSEEALSSEENSASAFFLHKDYWDWFETEGLRGFVGVYPSPFFELQLGVVQRDEASLENNTNWSLFNQKDRFVDNPAILEGQYRAFQLMATYDSRPRNWKDKTDSRSTWGGVEYWLRAGWERADGGLGGDFDSWRAIADLRTYFRISTRQSIATRIFAGTGEDRTSFLPPQRRFFLGGLGTLRGHNYRSLEGDHAVLAPTWSTAFPSGRGIEPSRCSSSTAEWPGTRAISPSSSFPSTSAPGCVWAISPF